MKKAFNNFGRRLLSRKFLLALLAGVVAFGNSFFGWGLDVEEIRLVVLSLLGYVVIEGAADFKAR